jgi:hypothetical protein
VKDTEFLQNNPMQRRRMSSVRQRSLRRRRKRPAGRIAGR